MERTDEIQVIINSLQDDVKRAVNNNYIHVDFIIKTGKLLEKYKNEYTELKKVESELRPSN
ncbi:hypothetical protein UFOVP104_18 [uncultured Caudovirales phage]|uniref:Uncharacterized protein n=1 Tax=uncultured Caudovirales phage TaxID=2100421 RepID=A0A6J5LN49_9CAUD|nr:hypothetical protein UFOVP104_18 [uncultured Caudovirales phage]CAB4134386.1 hypothetical protein UFOVP271_53 [uncultured Caudovirales phage]